MSSKFALFASLAAIGAVTALALPAQSSVTYMFDYNNGAIAFTAVTPSFITTATTIPHAGTTSCTYQYVACVGDFHIDLYPGGSDPDTIFTRGSGGGNGYLFASGVLGAFGSSTALYVPEAHLSVTDTPTGVPEPATWALMLVGWVGMGAMLRSRRRGAVKTA